MLLIPYLRDLCLKSRSWRFSHIFSSRSFVVFVFAFMSTIHFESVFAHGLRWRFTFICVCTFSCPSIICWNDHRFPLNQLYWATDFITLEADPLLDFQLCDLINTFPHCLHSFEFCIILWSQKPSGWNRCCQEVAPGRSSGCQLCRRSME